MFTILVLAYNAEDTITDTLDSIYRQNYEKPFNIIVADDASTDATSTIAKAWIEKNGVRFSSAIVSTNKYNLGTSKQINTRMNEIDTEWVVFLGGDDILSKTYLNDAEKYIKDSGCNTFLTSYNIRFQKENNEVRYSLDIDELKYINKICSLEANDQYKLLLKKDMLCSPSMIVNKKCFDRVGGCDEDIRNIEDWPLKLRFTQYGYKIYLLKRFNVYYRIGNSVSHSNEEFFKPSFMDEFNKLKRKLCYPNVPKSDRLYRYNEAVTNMRYWTIIHMFGNKRNTASSIANSALGLLSVDKWSKAISKFKDKKLEKELIKRVIEKENPFADCNCIY